MAVGAATPPGVTWEDTGSGEKEIERTSFRYYPLWLSARADPPGVTWEDTGSGEEEMERTSFRHHPLRPSARADPTRQYFKLSRIRQSAVRRSDSR